MDLSIIIPAYNESNKIATDVLAASEFLEHHMRSGEIIIVDDGSTDDTQVHAELPVPPRIKLDVIRYDTNRGKGYAVKQGMLRSSGDLVMFADSGLCIPYENALRGIKAIQQGRCELAHGSRKLPESRIIKKHLKSRQITSFLFKLLLRIWLHVPHRLTDTQCGFKIYKGDIARELYSESIIDGFQFDIEIILRAVHKGYRILEFPVDWSADPDSRLNIAKMPRAILHELCILKKELSKEFAKSP